MRQSRHRILFGTTNEAKLELLRAYLEHLPVEILSPADLNIHLDVEEDGLSAEENALKKAQAYYQTANLPTFAIDAGLRIEKFSEEDQPGVYVRRISRLHEQASDEQILAHYRQCLAQVGGSSPGTWTIAIAFIASPEQISTRQIQLSATMTATPSRVFIPGAPLSSLMIDPLSGRYYAEMAHRERPDSQLIAQIISEQIEQGSMESRGGSGK